MQPLDTSLPSLAVIILTYNEERHLARAIRSVQDVAEAVYVVDSFSSDRTVEIARSLGATVLQNRFINHSKQFQWALDNAPIASQWIMRLDADEVVEPDLSAEMKAALPRATDDVVGFNLKRRHIFLGKWIRFGGRYPLVLLRVWRRGKGRIEDRWMDEHIVVDGGRIMTLNGRFSDVNLNDLTFFTDKHNRYATREAIDVINERLGLFSRDAGLASTSTPNQAVVKRFIKEKLFNRLPFQISALSYFLYRYILQLGFLDGKEGLIYHFLQGFWYRFLVGAKIVEFERELSRFSTLEAKRNELARLTGFSLE